MSRPYFGEGSLGQKYQAPESGTSFSAAMVSSQIDWDAPSESDDDTDQSSDDELGAFRSNKPKKPKHIKQYIIGGLLGEGAYAKVKEGIDGTTLRIVAIKIIDRRFLRKVKNGETNLKREVAIMKALGKHPNIIQLIQLIDDPDAKKMYIILELANGCTVQDLIDNAPDNKIPPEQLKKIFKQLMVGLNYIHGKNVVHRDIKPANLMLTTDSELKISDFGVAEFLNKYNAEDHVTCTSGSPAFQAPEIARGDPNFSGIKIDVWAAGVTLFYCLTGKIPFQAENLMELFNKISDASYEIPDEVDPVAKDLIHGMLRLDQELRFNIQEVLAHPWLKEAKTVDTASFLKIPMREPKVLKIVNDMFKEEEEEDDDESVPALTVDFRGLGTDIDPKATVPATTARAAVVTTAVVTSSHNNAATQIITNNGKLAALVDKVIAWLREKKASCTIM